MGQLEHSAQTGLSGSFEPLNLLISELTSGEFGPAVADISSQLLQEVQADKSIFIEALPDRLFEYILTRLAPHATAQQLALVLLAYKIASEAHAGDKRDDGSPYIIHPIRVAITLIDEAATHDWEIVCVAILHDVVEDSKITVEQIREKFGDRIARGVDAVSKDRTLSLPKNLERVANAADAGAPEVRLADRIDNVRTSVYRHQPDKVLQPIDEAERYFLPFAKVHNPALRAELIKAVGHAIYLVRDVGRYGKDDFRGVLRTAVLDVHKALGELELLAHLDSPEITIDYYLRYLKRVWGLIEPIERELTKSPLASEGFGLTERIAWKAERIRKDMTALGVADVEIDNLPCIEPVPALNTLPKTLGVIYAIEGSMLGGVAIRGNVESALTLSETSGASFLNTYGDVKSTTTHVSAFMNSLTALVDRAPDPKRIQEEIVVSAVDMFIRTHDWYS